MRSAKWAAVEKSWVIMRMPVRLLAQPGQQGQDPGPYRHVQHRRRLVSDQQLRLQHQAGGDGDPLALAAGQLMRVAVEVQVGRGQPRPFQRVPGALAALGAVAHPWMASGSSMWRDPESGVERLVGVLVDQLHVPAQLPQRLGGQMGNVFTLEAQRPRGRFQHAQHGPRGGRLAAARLADEREQLALATVSETPSTARTYCCGSRRIAPTSPRRIG
jgi:hypothetical protein